MDHKALPADLSAEEFRRYGYQVIDWIADYLQNPERYPVLAQVQPGDIKRQLPSEPPRQPESFDAMLADFQDIILPGITHWNNPNFYAFFANSSVSGGILGEVLAAALNANGMLWRSSPSVTELEEVVTDWLRQMMGLPAEFKGIITDTASISTLLAIAAAREALNRNIRQEGMAGRSDLPRLRLYTSEQAHSSVEKDAMALGIGQAGVRKIPTDAEFRMDVSALRAAIAEDLAAGWLPFCVVATVGTTSTTSIDPVAEIAPICQEHGLWLHVDAAYAGVVAIIPERRDILQGCEHADSFVTNPHKWLFTTLDASTFYIKEPDILKRAFSVVPEYLKTSGEVNNYMDWGVQLGRRFRALKLWMTIRQFGQEGLAALLEHHLQLAQHFAAWIDAHPDFERLAPTPFSTVCFRFHPQELRLAQGQAAAEQEAYLEQVNNAILDAINASGEAFFGHTKLQGRYSLRVAIGNIGTQQAHLQRLWELLQQEASRLHSEQRKALSDSR